MNKIFKVIFNRTTQQLEVVSELAKSQGKAASSVDKRGSVNLLAGALTGAVLVGGSALLMLSAAPAEAVISIVQKTENYQYPEGANSNSYRTLYNYLNPGSLSYANASVLPEKKGNQNYRSYDANTSLGIQIGKNTNILAKPDKTVDGIAIGDYAQATGGAAIAIGIMSKATDIGAIALGTAAFSDGFNSFAAMRQSAARGDYSAAIGSASWANGTGSFSLGASATSLGQRSFAIGSGIPQTISQNEMEQRRSIYDGNNNTLASGNDAFSIGTKAKTNGNNSFAIGTNAWSGGFKQEVHATIDDLKNVTNPDPAKVANNAFALGTNTRAQSDDSVAFSTNATANGTGSIAFGVNTNTTGTGAIAFGNASKAWANNSISIGWNATSHAEKVISIGSHSNASKAGAMAIGDTAKSSGNNSVAIGYQSNVSGVNATAIGTRTKVTGEGATAIGFEANASNKYATAIAHNSSANGERSLAAGVNSTAKGLRSMAVGDTANATTNDDIAFGSYAKTNTKQGIKGTQGGTMAIGVNSKADGDNAIAVGNNATAEYNSSIALGGKASGIGATNIGYQANTTGNSSVGIGYYAKANGNFTTAIGSQAKAIATLATAIGASANATKEYSVALGATSVTDANATMEDNATVNGITYAGFAGQATGDNYSVSVGSSTVKRQIKNVAAGNISANSTDAINGSQLYVTNRVIGNVANAVKQNFGGNATVDKNGNITFTNIGDTGKDNIHDAIKAARSSVKAGTNTNVTESVGTNGEKVYTVNAYNTTVVANTTAGNNYIQVGSAFNNQNNTTTYTLGLTKEAISNFTKDSTAKVEASDNTINVTNSTTTVNGVNVTTYKIAVNASALPTQIQYFSVNSTVEGNKNNDGAKGINSIAIGPNAAAVDQGAIALGANSSANGNAAASFGVNSTAKGIQATAVGSQANATANATTAVGRETIASAGEATAVGSNAQATGEKASAFGVAARAMQKAALALGTNANATAQSALAVGTQSKATANFSTALGAMANASLENSVALGSNSTVAAAENVTSATVGGVTYSGFAGNSTEKGNVVSVGSETVKRQIQNVAAGRIASNSTDAINGSQLYVVASKLQGEIAKGFNIDADNRGTGISAADNVKLGETVNYTSKDKNIVTTVTNNTIDFGLNSTLKIGGKGKDGQDGAPGIGLDGNNGTIGLTGPKGADGKSATANITVKNGKPGVDGTDGTNKTRIVYDNEEVATLKDGLKFGANNGTVHNATLNTQVNVTGATANTDWNNFDQGQNIMTQIKGSNITVALAKNVNLTEAGSLTIGNTTLNTSGLTIKGGPNVTQSGINAGNKQITNVSSGLTNATGQKTDLANATQTNAVNVGDLKETVANLTNSTTGGFGLTDNNGTVVKQDLGKTIQIKGKDGVTVKANTTSKALEVALEGNVSVSGKDGKDGSIGVKGTDGKDGVTINGNGTITVGKDGAPGKIGINGSNGTNASMTTDKGAPNLDEAKGKDGKNGNQTTRVVYTNEKGQKEEISTLNDGLRFTGNNEVENKHKLNSLVSIIGEGVTKEQSTNFTSAAGNINVKADGQGNLTVQLAKDVNLTANGSVKIGGTNVTNEGITINNGPKLTSNNGDLNVSNATGGAVKITNVKDGNISETSKDAVNGSQLYTVQQIAKSGWNISANGTNSTNVGPKGNVSFNNEDGNIVISKAADNNNITFALNNNLTVGGKPGTDGAQGKAGQIGVKGADGKDGLTLKPDAIVFHGVDGVNGKNGADGKDGVASVKVEKGSAGLDGNDGKDGQSKTRIVYEKPNGEKEEVATLKDGLKFGANNGTVHNAKLNTQVDVKGDANNTDWAKFDAGKNVMTQITNNTITVALATNLTGLTSATFGKDSDSTVINKDGITISKKDQGDSSKTDVKLTENGLDNGGNKITNVADGNISKDSKEAVNGSQLYQVREIATSGWDISANGSNTTNVGPKGNVSFNNEDGNIVINKAANNNNITFALNNNLTIGGKDGKDGSIGVKGADGKDGVTINGNGTIVAGRDGTDGVDGSIGANGKNGSSVVLNGKDGSIGLTGPRGTDGKPGANASISVKDGAEGVDGQNGQSGLPGKNGKTRIVYDSKDSNGTTITEEVATLNDGLIFTGNNEDTKNRHKLNTLVKVQGEGVTKEDSANFTSAAGNINVKANGTDKLELQLNKDLNLTSNGSVTIGNTTVNTSGVTIVKKPGGDGKSNVTLTQDGLNNGGNQITNVDSGLKQKDGTVVKLENATGEILKNATNVGDLQNAVKDVISKGFNIEADNSGLDNQSKTDHVDLGETVKFTDPDHNIVTTVKDNQIQFGLNSTLSVGGKDGKPGEIGIKGADGQDGVSIKGGEGSVIAGRNGKDGDAGVDGKVGATGKDGSSVVLNGKDGSIGFTGPKGQDGSNGTTTTLKVEQGKPGVNGKDGETKTRFVYETSNKDGQPVKEEVATLNDGLKFVGDDGEEIAKKLNETLSIIGGEKDPSKLSDTNIGVVKSKDGLVVKLAKHLKDLSNATFVKEGENEPTTVVDNNGLTITPKQQGKNPVKLTQNGLDNGNNQIVNVTSGINGQKDKDGKPITSVNDLTEEQLKQVGTNAANINDVRNATDAIVTKGFNITADNSALANGEKIDNVKLGETVNYTSSDKNIITTVSNNTIDFALNNNLTIGGPSKDGKPGKDGSVVVKGSDGNTSVALNGKDGSIGINGKDGSNGNVTFAQGKPGVDGKDGETKTRFVYETKDKDGKPVKEEVATLNDGLKFVGDDGKVTIKKLNETLGITGGEKDATKLSDANNIGIVNENGNLTVKLAKNINLTKDGSVTIGNTTVNNDGLTIKDGPSVTKAGISAGDKQITNVSSGLTDAKGQKVDLENATKTNAVNVGDLKETVAGLTNSTTGGFGLTDDNATSVKQDLGKTIQIKGKDGVTVTANVANKALEVSLAGNVSVNGKDGKDGSIGVKGADGKDGVAIKGDGTIIAGRDGKDGVDGKIGATGKDGASVVLNGKDGSIGLTGPKGADGKPGASINIAAKDGAEGVDGVNGKDGLPGQNGQTRLVYETKDKEGKTITEQVASLNDGLIFSGNNEQLNRHKLNTVVRVVGEGVDKTASNNFKSATGNINVKANGSDTLEVQLAKNLNLTKDGSITVGDTKVDNKGLTINDGPSVTKSGIDAKGTRITNVKNGEVNARSTDAVNGSQLYHAVQNSGWELAVDGNVAKGSEIGSKRVNNNGQVTVSGGKNVVVSRKDSTVEIATSNNPEFETVKVGGTTISSSVAKDGVNELNVAGNNKAPTRITNVAPGVNNTDAVNVSQLKGAIGNINNRINKANKQNRAGIAGANAAVGLPQVYMPGKSMVAAAAGTFKGQSAVAVGYSRASDNGKLILKLQGNANTQGDVGGSVGVGYQW